MRKTITAIVAVFVFFALVSVVRATGFDEYGYNLTARNFVGTCLSWGQGKYNWSVEQARNYCGAYSNDRLVMKWNKAWDDCNHAGNDDEAACAGAWLNNEWNGAFPGGSGEVWHYKIIWVGSAGENSAFWQEGGYLIWGNYETLMDQGTADGIHTWNAKAVPDGYGVH